MPRLSDSMEEGTILKWLAEPGAAVERGQEIVEIETDKATMTYEADAAGVLAIVAAEGDTLPIGALIATIGGASAPAANGTAPASEQPSVAAPVAPAPPAASAPAPPASAPAPPAVPPAPATALSPPALAPPPPTEAAPIATESGARVKASPLARRLARERGVDVATISGTGPGGRVVKADVEAAAAAPPPAAPTPAAAPAPAAPAQPAGNRGDVTVVEPTRTQSLIARRMAEAKATIPEFQVSVAVDAEAAFALREELRGVASPLPSLNDVVIKACALALREHPRVNASYKDGRFELYSRVNVGMAVAAEGTLVVPTIFDADVKSLTAVAADTRALAGKVRDGSVAPPDLAGGTFTVSNLGMFGVSHFTAVINTPQAAILAVGAAVPRAVPGPDGALVARRVMELTLSADHRIVYGADAAAFLGTVRELVEQPLRILV